MIPRLRPYLGWEELAGAWTTARNNEVEKFEKAFATVMGVKSAIAFPYGRTGLTILLRALGLEQKEVICPAYTCVVVPHAIVTSGNEPLFIDSCRTDFNMNLDLASRAVNEQTGAVIATSIFGYPVNLEQLQALRDKNPRIFIIQDCAHSFNAEWKGYPVHKMGDAAIFGLNISKMITSIFGGMVTTDHDYLAEKIRHLRDKLISTPTWSKSLQRRLYLTAIYFAFSKPVYSLTNYLERFGLLNRFVKYYDEDTIEMPRDYLIGLSNVESKVGQIQLKHYRDIIDYRRKAAEYYNDMLQGVPNIELPPLINGATYSHYVPRVERRDDLIRFALNEGVQLGRLIEYCIPKIRAYRNRPGSLDEYPVAGQMAQTTINLPVWSRKQEDLAKVVRVIKKFMNKTH